MLRIAGRIAKLGGWVVSLADQTVSRSDESAAIHGEGPGLPPAPLEGGFVSCVPEHRESVRQAFAACAVDGIPFDLELEIITRKGRRVWVRSAGEAVRDAAGTITHVQGALQDISDQKAAAEEIQSLGSRLHETLEAITDAFFTLDRQWRFTYLNRGAERLLQREREQLLGRNIWTEFSEAVGTLSDREYHRAMADGILVRFEQFYPPLNRWLSAEAHPTRDGLAVYFRDVTDRHKEQETHLEELEGRYRGLLDAAPDAMVVVNQAGGIVLANLQTEIHFGYSHDELIGQPVTTLIPEGFAERLIADGTRTAAEALAQQIGTGIELSGQRKDGSRFPIEIMLSPLESADGVLVTAAIRDISVRKQAEKLLAQTESKYRGLLEAAPDAMVVVNQAGEIVLSSLQAENHFGYRREELIGQPVTTIIPEGFAERLIADGTRTAAEALAQQIGTGIELSGRRKDGSRFPIEIMLSPLESADGVLVTAAIRDITVRKQAEKVLAQAESRYRGLLEAAPDAMVVVNQAGEIVLSSLQAENHFGYSRDELIGQPVTTIIPEGFAERLIADGTRTAAEALAQQIGTGIELSGRRKDGSRFPIEIMLSPLESADGVLVTAAIRDISVRKQAERHLARVESRHRALLEAAPDPMMLVNQTGHIVVVNLQAERVFGYRRDELVGMAAAELCSADSAVRLRIYLRRSPDGAFATQDLTPIEVDGRRKDGSGFPIELMLAALDTDEGMLLTVAIRDITTRKKGEAQLLQTVADLNRSNEDLGQFAYIASHDLQEPLRMVASYTQLLSKRYTGRLDADADEFIGYAVDGANRMQRLIQDLLLYSRTGTKGLPLLDTSSADALDEALANLRGAIEASGALVTHDPLPSVWADEGQLVQLFQNLVGNAIKYQSGGTPKVHVSSVVATEGTDRGRWTFSVRDNGLGIEAKYFEKIFGMFQRLHKREEFAGTGIGLAICKKIVERHGGTLSVESALGQGSTFRFALAGSGRIS